MGISICIMGMSVTGYAPSVLPVVAPVPWPPEAKVHFVVIV